MRLAILTASVGAALFVLGACSYDPGEAEPALGPVEPRDFGPAPDTPSGPLEPATQRAIELAVAERDPAAIDAIGASGDPRLGWLLADLLRFAASAEQLEHLSRAAESLLGVEAAANPWGDVSDHLIAWDTPAPPDYLVHKRGIFTAVVPQWEPLFADDADIDWRLVSWGGVGIDDRPFGETDAPCDCIPAADDPERVAAADTDWPADEDVVFGVEINGEARAYPRQIMEVREMVNDTLGGRDIAMPYCTLCGSAQVYLTDDVPAGVERPVLRTSGLLIRSNKVMFDQVTGSVFDTFTGAAVSGPLRDAGVTLEQAGVVTTTWGAWRDAHPDTTVLVEALALGRDPDFRSGRDANGPIFPIGVADPRLPLQADVVGIVTGQGRPVAFPVTTATAALEDGETIEVDDIALVLDGGGLRVVDRRSGDDAGGHQAFWFAWSQFHPDTGLWPDVE